MRPNWRITYDGLTTIPFIENYFRSITLSHAYSSNYNIGSYASNLNYSPSKDDGFSYAFDALHTNFVPEYDVDMVSINEQFTPLFGIDMTWKNNLTSRFEYKKIRTLIFSLKSYSISETRSDEYVIGMGYRFEEVPLKFITLSGSTTNVKSDLNLRGDFSIKNDFTVLRRLDQIDPETISARKSMNLSITADYALSDKLNVKLFYTRDLQDAQGSYLNTNTSIGFSIRFTLTQ
jgi:cell surface protein SprA